MRKRWGGQNSAKARKGTAEPDAERNGSEDDPMGEPPIPTPYTRLVEAEAQTASWPKDTEVETMAKLVRIAKHQLEKNWRDTETQTPGKADSVWAAVQAISGYTPRNEKDRVMLTRAALEEHYVVIRCPQCKAGTLTDVIVVVALCAPLPCQKCGYTLMRPAGESDKATAAAFK